MFDNLTDKLHDVFTRLRGKGKLTEADVNEALREVRLALLEADVSFKVVKDFIARVKDKAVGGEVLETLQPAQQVVKIVHDELLELLGGDPNDTEASLASKPPLTLSQTPPTVLMMCGLQGAGKTTLCGKLARYYKKQGRNPLLVACDIQRPAAVKQLQVLGGQVGVPVYASPTEEGKAPPTIARQAIAQAKEKGNDIVILDTAGRLAIDQDLMDELGQMKAYVAPNEILLVVDAMVGQDAVNFAQEFNEQLGLSGFVMTKMDGDTRGGAALSIRAVTGVPILFLGTGEKLDALEPFYPDRLASRILGMGDILSLIEKAQEAVDEKTAEALEKKLREKKFDLNDFLEQMQQMKKLGDMQTLMKMLPMIPGISREMINEVQVDPKLMPRKEAIIRSMTHQERANPQMINGARRRRIASGCGQSVQEVNQFLNEFEQMRKMMQMMMADGGGKRGIGPFGKGPGGGGAGLLTPRKPRLPGGGKIGKKFPFKR